jgi:hypothetical protein
LADEKKKRKEGEREVGRSLGRAARKRRWAARAAWPRAGKSWAKEGERERETRGVWFFLTLFKLFFSNFANFTQTIKPCIRTMMHKHLLILKLLK